MNKTQWAYEQGYQTALRSLGIKDDDTVAGEDQDTEFAKVAEPLVREASSMDRQIDVDWWNKGAKFLDESVDTKILQEVFEKNKALKELSQRMTTLMDAGNQEGLSVNNSQSFADLFTQKNQIQMYIENYAKLVASIKELRQPLDKYMAALGEVTGQG